MKQIIQSYKTGKMEIIDVPPPACGANGVLVQTSVSLISPGTEKMLIDIAKKSLLGKAKARPDLVKQVLNKIQKEGLKTTLNKVFTKLEIPIPLGYSCTGKVLMTGEAISGIFLNDRVACAGAGFANHAEVNYIPGNLLAKVPDGVSDEDAAYTTVGSIALQGLRQLNPTLGEKIAVIGAGLIGLLSIQLLKANGCEVLAMDIDPVKLEFAQQSGADCICAGADLYTAAEDFSGGRGVDGVIIAASSQSRQIVADAGEICRMKGRVIMVGLTPIEIPRDIFYKKELEFKLSMSYGPGRYDPAYEIAGIDYPFAYVRWTEQRNMQAFLSLAAQKKLNLTILTTHRFDFENVFDAYRLISGDSKESYLGILLRYKPETLSSPARFELSSGAKKESEITLGFVGAGNFARAVILPALKKTDASLVTLVNTGSINLITAGRKFVFQNIASDTAEVFDDERINTVFIATRHDSHANLVIRGLQSGKHVFVEKPLAIMEDELVTIRDAYQTAGRHLMVGFNRRFSSHAGFIKEALKNGSTSLVMNYIVNAGFIEANHWIQNWKTGGGRIIGEVCHFVDFISFISASIVTAVYACAIKTSNRLFANNDSLQITLELENGSIANITYHAIGDTTLPKEYFELSGGERTVKLYDFRRTEITHRGRTRVHKSGTQDKGFDQELRSFFDAIRNRQPTPISFDSLYNTTLTTFRILESIQTGLRLEVK